MTQEMVLLSHFYSFLTSEAIIRRDKYQSYEIYDFCNGGCNHVAYNETCIANNEGVSCKILKCVYL